MFILSHVTMFQLLLCTYVAPRRRLTLCGDGRYGRGDAPHCCQWSGWSGAYGEITGQSSRLSLQPQTSEDERHRISGYAALRVTVCNILLSLCDLTI